MKIALLKLDVEDIIKTEKIEIFKEIHDTIEPLLKEKLGSDIRLLVTDIEIKTLDFEELKKNLQTLLNILETKN